MSGSFRLALRALMILVAVSAVSYALARIPAEGDAEPIVTLADRIVNGSNFDPQSLGRYEPVLAATERDTTCGPTRGAIAAIRGYQVQQAAIASDAGRAAEFGQSALRMLRLKLACAPQDGLSWYTLFLLESSLSGRARANLPFLLMSYKVSPNEGQLMRIRAQVSTALLPLVGPELQGHIRSEFIRLGRDDGTTVVGILLGSGETLHRVLLPLLESVPAEQRAFIADRLANEGSEIKVPGVPAAAPGGLRR